jgi:hypothetical protein
MATHKTNKYLFGIESDVCRWFVMPPFALVLSSTWDFSFQEQCVSMIRINIPCLVSVILRWNALNINFPPLRMIYRLHRPMRQRNHWMPWPGPRMKPITVAHRLLNIRVGCNNSRTSLKVSNTKVRQGKFVGWFLFRQPWTIPSTSMTIMR